MVTLQHVLLLLPALLYPYRRIFLLSYMRAYTSLFGHLLGSHPEIEGYYELQIGYYSWRSLIRQKVHYFLFHGHTPKKQGRLFFDKVLHNGYQLDEKILNRAADHFILALRPPGETIPSIIQLYQRVAPNDGCATEQGAFQYYSERLDGLLRLSEQLSGRYIYLDAACLTEKSKETLNILRETLDLKSPIQAEYESKSMTGRPSRGDLSDNIKTGKILSTRPSSSRKVYSERQMYEAMAHYEEIRASLIRRSRQSFLID